MMSPLPLFYVLAFLVLTVGIRYLIIFQRLFKMALQPTRFEVLLPETIPESLRQVFQSPIKALEALGFYPCYALQIDNLIHLDADKTWGMLFYHRVYQSYGIAEVRANADPTYLFNIDFCNFFKDSTLLLTTNGKAYGTIGQIPCTLMQDFYTSKLDVQWQKHLETLKQQIEAQKQPCQFPPLAFLKQLERHLELYLASLVKQKQVSRIKGTQLYKLSWKLALATTHNLIQGTQKATTINRELALLAKQNPELILEIPIELEVQGFRAMQLIERGMVKRQIKTGVFILTLFISMVSFSPLVNFNVTRILILIAALILHEVGHFLAMRYYGYQDTSIFFIPFFGAAATGQKDTATVTEKFWVLIAGPLPGLILGLILVITNPNFTPNWVIEAGWILIFLNLFNLLPILPFDGGKIANLLIFSRYPYTDIIFKGFATLVLILLGLSTPIFGIIAIAVASTIPLGFRSAKLDSKLRVELRQNPTQNSDQLLYRIFSIIKNSPASKLSFNQRYSLAKDLLQRHRESDTKWLVRLTLILGYSLCLAGGFIGSLQALVPSWFEMVSISINPQWVLRTEITKLDQWVQKDPHNAQIYQKRARTKFKLQRVVKNPLEKHQIIQEILADLNYSITLDPDFSEAYYLRSRVYRQLGDYKQAKQDFIKSETLVYTKQIKNADEQLRENPNDIMALLNRGEAKLKLKDIQGALQDYNQVIKIDSKSFLGYYYRSRAYYEQADYQKALADINQSIEKNQNFEEGYDFRGAIRARLGDVQGAQADLQKAEELTKKRSQQNKSHD